MSGMSTSFLSATEVRCWSWCASETPWAGTPRARDKVGRQRADLRGALSWGQTGRGSGEGVRRAVPDAGSPGSISGLPYPSLAIPLLMWMSKACQKLRVQSRCLTSPPSLLPASPPQPCPSSCPRHALGAVFGSCLCATAHICPIASPTGSSSKRTQTLEVLSTVTATSQVQAPPPLR